MNREHDVEPTAADSPWLSRTVQTLDDSVRDLDGATLSRLNRARQAALDELARPRRRFWLWPAAFAAACSLVLAVGVWRSASAPTPVPQPLSTIDFDLVAGTDSLDLYDDDLEFYAWLDQQQRADG